MDLAIADLDGDGLADLAVANHETDHVTLLFGLPEGPSNTGTTRDSASTSRRTRTPFDCTTSTPTATRTLVDDRSPESIRLFRGRGDGTFSGAPAIDVGGDPYRGMSLADVTGDGLADLITPNPDHVAVLVAGADGGARCRKLNTD